MVGFSYTGYDMGNSVEVYLGVLGGKSMVFENVTMKQMSDAIDVYDSGALIQKAFPFLDDVQREFLMTGTTSEEWDKMFGEEE